MLDRTDFESWQQRIRLYCLGKDNGENIMKSITEGPERARVFTDLSAEEKERYKADIRATNILLQGSELTKMTWNHRMNNYEFARLLTKSKERPIHVTMFSNMRYMSKEKQNDDGKVSFNLLNDPLALVSNASNQTYPTQSSESPQFSNQPSLVDNCQMDTRSTSTDNLIESLTNTLALLRTSSNARNKATVQDDRVVVQDVRDRYNEKHSLILMNMWMIGTAICKNHVFDADQCDAFASDVDEAPTTQTMFMVNLSSKDPIYDEAGPSYDSNTPFEVKDHDTLVDHMDEVS
ncbi:hypothetical protein Tco_0617767 [Tanacetum coccineum]